MSKKIFFLFLAVVAVTCARLLLFSVHDPEGPNLLVVTGMGAIIYLISISPFLFYAPPMTFRKMVLALGIQLLVSVGIYFWL